ncbi:hypothetical protein E4U21_000233 [Claviceps maximensis]|nr:hypothetical protein E4U21_000233 [Claviceps maximensis]
MKSAKPTPVDAPSHRRSQPSRQARTNASRRPANSSRADDVSNAANGGRTLGAQPVDILPAITHFADSMSALPKELVRHFTLLKEVDAKIFAPEEQLFKLVAATTESRLPEFRTAHDASNTTAPSASVPLSLHNSCSGTVSNQAHSLSAAVASAGSAAGSASSVSSTAAASTSVFEPSNIPRRQLFRQTAFKIKEMLVSLEEKNHVLSTANEALQRQLARVEDVWPYLENEFSDEAKWGSTTHWAYPENRASGKVSQTEKMRRDGAAAISAAAQALAEEAAARSDARKQAVQARKSLKTQHHDSDVDDGEKRQKDVPKKTSKSRKSAVAAAAATAAAATIAITDNNHVSLSVSGSTPNGSHPPKRRRVEKTANGEKVTSVTAANNLTNAVTTISPPPPPPTATTTTTSTTAAPTSTSTPTPTPTPASASAPASVIADASSSSAAITTGSATAGTAAGSLSLTVGNDALKAKTISPKGTPAPDGHKKRKALPTGSGQAKKKNGISASATTSPVLGAISDPKAAARASPAPGNAPRSAPFRDRRNSIQSNADNSRVRPPSSASVNKINGHEGETHTPEQASSAPFPKPGLEGKSFKEAGVLAKTTEVIKRETENPESVPSLIMTTTAMTPTTTTTTTPSTMSKKDSKTEETDPKSDAAPQPVPPPTTKKSSRTSKPSTPALATFQEAVASRSRLSRAAEGNNSSIINNNSSSNNTNNSNNSSSNNGNSNNNNNNTNNNTNTNTRKSHKKASLVAQQALIQQVQTADTDASSSMQGDDDEGEIDADEPTYCYCNSVSYGEMVACDADGCEREWFHLACVGLKVAPGSKTKWYCEDCKDPAWKFGRKKGQYLFGQESKWQSKGIR